jgi:hypothetical protein
MAVPVEVPKPGNAVEGCLIAKWLKQDRRSGFGG